MADIIAAIATGGGVSAIGMIRVSGDGAINVADRVFRVKSGISMCDAADRKLYYGELLDEGGEVIDLCLCTVSRAPNSYTGEDTAEFQCHGSPVVLSAGLRALFAVGARQAAAGEFTKRAFLNGRMDLSQAEAVIDLIEAETAAGAKNAAGQLAGAVGRKADAIYNSLLNIMAHFHAVIDYPDEDIEDFQLKNYIGILDRAAKTLERLLATFARGQILKVGVKCAIIGRPNTGKSSLLNAIVGYDRAIVTPLPGTTRDTIEEKVCLGDVVLRLTDTAGIRETSDLAEKLGVVRALSAAEEAELVIAVLDGSEELTDEDFAVLESAKRAERAVAVINKSDLSQMIDINAVKSRMKIVCPLSAVTGDGLEALEATVKALFPGGENALQGELLTNARHADAMTRALHGIKQAKDALATGVTPDAVLTEVEAALSAIGEITGKTMREDITARIFERFCVGK